MANEDSPFGLKFDQGALPNLMKIIAMCRQCHELKQHPNTTTGLTMTGIQIWCENCQTNVVHIEIGPIGKMPGCDLCKHGIEHKH